MHGFEANEAQKTLSSYIWQQNTKLIQYGIEIPQLVHLVLKYQANTCVVLKCYTSVIEMLHVCY